MKNLKKGKNVIICSGCQLGNNITIEDDVYIDYNTVIRDNVTIKKGTTIGPNCILGEHQSDYYKNMRNNGFHPLVIGEKSVIRSGTVIYGDTVIGENFSTGHNVTIREGAIIGKNVSVGTLSDIQGNCEIGDYVRMHSNVHIGMKSKIEDFVWIFPYCVLTNDPTPPSNVMYGVIIKKFAVVATGSILLPGIVVNEDSLIAAGAIVTKNVPPKVVVAGNPAKIIVNDISEIRNRKTGEVVYPWRYSFNRGMPWEEYLDYDIWLQNNRNS